MRVLSLDYGTATRLPRWVGIGLLVAGLGMVLLMGYQYRALTAETTRWNNLATAAALGHTRPVAVNPERAAIEINQAVEVVAQLSLPWDALFEAVESASNGQIALLDIEPDAQQQTVKITGETKTLASMLDYQRQLGQQPLFRNVHLQHHEVALQDPEKPVRFILVATWQS